MRWATPARSSPTTTRSPRRVRALREHGQRAKYRHEFEGYTARLDTMQALVLLHKLPLLDGWNEQRREVGRLYGEGLDGVGDLALPPVAAGSEPVWHLYVVRTDDAGAAGRVPARARRRDGRHYPEPPHLSQAYAGSATREGAVPGRRGARRRVLSLPIFPGITDEPGRRGRRGRREYFAVADAPGERRAIPADRRRRRSATAWSSHSFTNLYGCAIGDETRIGPFVEIQRGAAIGARCKIQSHTFICDGVEIEDEVFVGHGVMFINDKRPRATTEDGELQADDDWELLPTVVERREPRSARER